MIHRITQPTKEQVRAYMTARESARRPPPSPEEIRRQLGWQLQRHTPVDPLTQFYQITTSCNRLSAQLALAWMHASFVPPLSPGYLYKNYL